MLDLCPLTPALSPRGARGKGSRSSCFSSLGFGAVLQVYVRRTNTAVSPLSARGRGGKGADLHVFQVLGSARYRRFTYVAPTPRSVPSPPGGRGGKGADLHVFQVLSSARYCRFTYVAPTPRSVPSPPGGEGEREPIFMFFKSWVRRGIAGLRTSHQHRGQSPLPQGARGKGSRSSCFSSLEFGAVSQVYVRRTNTAVSPLSPRGRGGKGADLHVFQVLSSARYCRFTYVAPTPRSVPSPSGRGLG